jgi:methionyl-tRNA synthetase
MEAPLNNESNNAAVGASSATAVYARGKRISWPARAVVTAGMPYGNKALHFGHVAGVFVPADAYARFLRDRLGADNVLFVSGTDCFGSPIQEGYRKACENDGFGGGIVDYVQRNHDAQKATLDAYGISLDIYEGSGIGRAGEVHQLVTNDLLRKLHENGHLRLMETLQFYDPEAGQFLNGRQVHGYCPVQGCKSEKAYADECDLGHQFDPADLIKPTSSLTGCVPELRPVRNWYFDLPNFKGQLDQIAAVLAADENVRPVVSQTVKEFLVPPVIYIKNELEADYRAIEANLPAHEFHAAEGNKQSFEIEFGNIEDRDAARDVLTAAGIRFRTGKALVPFRISGNVEWGVKVPELEGVTDLTVWCWPESLWAPISFSATALEARGGHLSEARDWWCSPDARVYQFIGQDNLYFYGVAQPALWSALESDNAGAAWPEPGDLQQTSLIANHHILFGKTKASSSGDVKPPSADELLNHYTVDQLRAHWLALGLGQKSVGFKPKPFDPDPQKRDDPRVADPVLKEGALLTNVFNRLARSVLYEAKNNFDGTVPLDAPTAEMVAMAQKTLQNYDALMAKAELHSVMSIMDEFIRAANKRWADGIKQAENADDQALRRQVLADSAYLLWIAALLMHPIVPAGCQQICDYLQFDPSDFFSWDHDFVSLAELASAGEADHPVRELPPRTDFFKKHPSQFK